jgi:hypothetical protein
MPGLRHRRYFKDRAGEARAIPPGAEVRHQCRAAERQTAVAAFGPRKVICDFVQSKPADYESNS